MKIVKKILTPADEYSWSGNTGEAIVFHTTLGNTYIGAEETLKIRHLSYHYVVDKDGTIYQLVELDRSAWHAGVKSNPNLRSRAFFGEDNPNRRSVGVAFVGDGNVYDTSGYTVYSKAITDKQRDAGVWLVKEIGKQTGVRYNANNIFYHREITDYKPAFVETIRKQVLEGLVGFKDETDAVAERTVLELTLKMLQLKLQLLLRQIK